MNRAVRTTLASVAAVELALATGCHTATNEGPAKSHHETVLQVGNFAFQQATKPTNVESVVALEGYHPNTSTFTDYASGVVVKSSEGGRFVLTALHVIEDKDDQGYPAKECRMAVQYASSHLPKGGIAKTTGTASSSNADQGLLNIHDTTHALNTVPAAHLSDTLPHAKIGDVVTFAGWEPTDPTTVTKDTVRGPSWAQLGVDMAPQQKEAAISRGIVLAQDDNSITLLSGVGPKPLVYQGDSGGAAFTRKGELLGTISSQNSLPMEAGDINYGVKLAGISPQEHIWLTTIAPADQMSVDRMAGTIAACHPN